MTVREHVQKLVLREIVADPAPLDTDVPVHILPPLELVLSDDQRKRGERQEGINLSFHPFWLEVGVKYRSSCKAPRRKVSLFDNGISGFHQPAHPRVSPKGVTPPFVPLIKVTDGIATFLESKGHVAQRLNCRVQEGAKLLGIVVVLKGLTPETANVPHAGMCCLEGAGATSLLALFRKRRDPHEDTVPR
jgi:hypothetical protein